MSTLDVVLIVCIAAAVAAFTFIIWSYVKGLKGSPRELWLLYLAKIIEYGAYGAANMAFILYLSADCGLGDISAGAYITAWSTVLTVCTMLVGAVCDAIGIKRTLVLGTIFLVFARFIMPLTDNIWVVSLFGFLPMAVGTAVVGPVMSVGIKKYTTKEGAALGFGLLYTMFNVGWALGGLIFDWVRGWLGEHEIVDTPIPGVEMSTYQVIFAIGFLMTFPTLILFMLMRTGVERLDTGEIVVTPPAKVEGNSITVLGKEAKKAAKDTTTIFSEVIRHKAFWLFLFMLGMLVFVRLVFFHFHYTWPKYGIRVLGEGTKIGNIYGVLNPLLIVFLVPFIAALTKKVSSYKMMAIGTTISAVAVFIATLPPEMFTSWMDSWVGELIFDKWLSVPMEQRQEMYIVMTIFVVVFTIGEALWSPRLMQFTAEIAPKGKEGSYIALSYLPYFAAKLIVGPMSGWLVATYTPEGAESYPNHQYVWYWIGGMALISPLGLFIFHKLFKKAERGELYDDVEEPASES